MPETEDRWIPKTHPLERDAEADDPFELMAERVTGDPDVMLECLLQEFAWLGWSADELWELFHHPGYPVLQELRGYFGDEETRRRVDRLAARWGHLRFRETIVEPDEEPEVYDIQFSPLALQPNQAAPDKA